jgi:hypothetical protein
MCFVDRPNCYVIWRYCITWSRVTVHPAGGRLRKSGEQKKAPELLKRLETTKEYVAPGELAVVYAALGEREKAFASLEKAYAVHDLQLQYLNADWSFDSLRDDPRFNDLKRRVRLP